MGPTSRAISQQEFLAWGLGHQLISVYTPGDLDIPQEPPPC